MTPGYEALFWNPSFEEIQGNNLFLVAVGQSDDNVQRENRWFRPLEERLTTLLTGLAIQGVPVSPQPIASTPAASPRPRFDRLADLSGLKVAA